MCHHGWSESEGNKTLYMCKEGTRLYRRFVDAYNNRGPDSKTFKATEKALFAHWNKMKK